jgi:phosphohistidine phosphatase
MPMDLILWRHADAGSPVNGVADLQRALTPKGRRQAARIARWLHAVLPDSTRILVSPALRTCQTVRALGRPFVVSDSIGPAASAEDLLREVGWPHADTPVLVVGHQPTLGEVASLVLAGVRQEWTIRKGSVWWMRSRATTAGMKVMLRAVRLPEGD